MPRLFSYFAPVFSFGLQLSAPAAAALEQPTGAEAQQRARRLLERARSAALAAGRSPQEVDSASFATVAWLDESMARNPQWAESMAPLQVQLFNSSDSRTEFFHHLAALPASDKELREIYWYALALGFKGQYYFEADGRTGERAHLMALHAAQLPIVPRGAETWPPSPRMHAISALRSGHGRDRLFRRGVALILVLFSSALLLLWNAAHWGFPTLAVRVEQALEPFTCADLSSSLSADGRVQVRGFVAQPEDIERVRQQVQSLAGVTGVELNLGVRPWPYCEVIAVLKPHRQLNRDGSFGLSVHVPTAPAARLSGGLPVQVQVRTPRLATRLWVDFYTTDGNALHLGPPGQPITRAQPKQTLEFAHDALTSWRDGPPLGMVLVTVVALPDDNAEFRPVGRPSRELASDYLSRLRESIASAPAPVLADYLFLQTVER